MSVVCPKCGKKGTRELEKVSCGKSGCKKCGGTRQAHGPYWYVYHRRGDKVVKCYVGKKWPDEKSKRFPHVTQDVKVEEEPLVKKLMRVIEKESVSKRGENLHVEHGAVRR